MADTWGDMINDVTRRSKIDDFPVNAKRIARQAVRYLDERLRLEEMVQAATGTADDDGRVAFGEDLNVVGIRTVRVGTLELQAVPDVQTYSGYIYRRPNRYLDSSEAGKDHTIEYFEGVKDPADRASIGFDLLGFNYDILFNSVLFHALQDANRYDEIAPVAELLAGTIDRAEINSSLDKYRTNSMALGRGQGYAP